MPRVRKMGYLTTKINLPDDVVKLIDTYAAINELPTRSAAITDIARHFFSNEGGLSPAMQATVKRRVARVDMLSIAPQFDFSKSDAELAGMLLNQLRPEFENTIATVKAFMAKIEGTEGDKE